MYACPLCRELLGYPKFPCWHCKATEEQAKKGPSIGAISAAMVMASVAPGKAPAPKSLPRLYVVGWGRFSLWEIGEIDKAGFFLSTGQMLTLREPNLEILIAEDPLRHDIFFEGKLVDENGALLVVKKKRRNKSWRISAGDGLAWAFRARIIDLKFHLRFYENSFWVKMRVDPTVKPKLIPMRKNTKKRI
jgi:hypothetical protein